MKYFFEAEIYKIGINWCVDVPKEITEKMIAEKGRIKIKGEINGFRFQKTLIPVKNSNHRFRSEAGSNYFVLSPQRWIESANATGIISKSKVEYY